MILWISAALAGGYEVAQQGVRAGGMAHAGTAAVAAESAWYNPSALTDGVPRFGLSGVVANPRIQSRAEAEVYETIGGPSYIPQVHGAWAWGDWAAGASLNAPFGGGVRWPADWPGRFDIVCSRTQVLRASPFVATRRGPVALSIGPHLDAGTLEVFKATDHVSEEGTAHLLLDGRGVGVDAALFLDLDEVDLGVSYKSRTSMRLSGLADFDVPDPFAATLPDQTVEADWTLPDRLAVGVAWRGLRLDATTTLWSVNDELRFEFAESDDAVNDYRWRNSGALRLGGETALQGFELRGGLALERTPAPVETLSAASPDGPRFSLTVGAGRALTDALRVDAFVEHLRILERQSDSTQASYGGSAWVAGVGVEARRFGAGRDAASGSP
ncbi:MAG TPA: outer membrane protein transport protein [Myxococcota bacterium]|nr:outer membrane protein transport protein [Myxococcota bacterium]